MNYEQEANDLSEEAHSLLLSLFKNAEKMNGQSHTLKTTNEERQATRELMSKGYLIRVSSMGTILNVKFTDWGWQQARSRFASEP